MHLERSRFRSTLEFMNKQFTRLYSKALESEGEEQPIRGVLTLYEVAKTLRCSKAHICNLIRGKVPDLPPLPIVRIGRRVLIRAESLAGWMRTVEIGGAAVRQWPQT